MNEINLLDLVSNMPKALPIPKEFVIVCKGAQQVGKRKYLFFTPIGYLFRTKFRSWLSRVGMTEQEWYDKYYLNIALFSQRPECNLEGCSNKTEFHTVKCGYEYSKFCCHSHCQKNNWSREGGEVSKEKMKFSQKQKYIDNPDLRWIKGEQTKEGFRKAGRYELDENGHNKFSQVQYSYHSSERGRENDKRRAENLRKENNPEFAERVKSSVSTDEHRDKLSKAVRKAMTKEVCSHLSEVRKNKIRTDKEFRRKVFDHVREMSKGSNFKSGYVFSLKCENSIDSYVWCDSSYEIAYLRQLDLDDSVVSYIKEPRDLDITYEINGDLHWYWPDLIVKYRDGSVSMIEIKNKGQRDNEENLLKYESARIYCNSVGYSYKIIVEDEVFSVISKTEAYDIHKYYSALKTGYKSLDEKLKEIIKI